MLAALFRHAAELYGMKILQEGIETNKHNFYPFPGYCRYLMADELKDSKVNKANIVFSLPHRRKPFTGFVYLFHFYKINLTRQVVAHYRS